LGLLQLMVIRSGEESTISAIAGQLRVWSEGGGVRLIDALAVSKDSEGEISRQGVPSPLELEAGFPGILAGSLFGDDAGKLEVAVKRREFGITGSEHGVFGLDLDQLMEIADLIPRSSSVLFLLIENLWTGSIRSSVEEEGGAVLAIGLITTKTLVDFSLQSASLLV